MLCAANPTKLIGCIVILFAALLCGANDLQACSPDDRPDCTEAVQFFQKLQDVVRRDDRAKLAEMMNYPLRVPAQQGHKLISSRKEFLLQYDRIFTSKTRCSVLAATTGDVWGNYRGFTIGAGVLWWEKGAKEPAARLPSGEIDWSKYPFRVVTINGAGDLDCKQAATH